MPEGLREDPYHWTELVRLLLLLLLLLSLLLLEIPSFGKSDIVKRAKILSAAVLAYESFYNSWSLLFSVMAYTVTLDLNMKGMV